MQTALSLVFSFLLSSVLLAQDDMTLAKEIPLNGHEFTTDPMGQVYTFKADVLNKFTAEGELQYTFTNKSYGSISYVDATNPLRILVFYQELSLVVFLDNTLSDHGEALRLTDLGYDQALAVCGSRNNGVWLFDQNTFQLVQLGDQAEVLQESGNLFQQLGREVDVNCMLERHNRLYANDPEHGVMVFDIFGTYIKTIPIKGLETFQVTSDYLYWHNGNQLEAFGFAMLDEVVQELPVRTAERVRVEGRSVFIQSKGSLQIWHLNG